MSSLVIGGTSIPVAVSSPSFSRSDAVDRGRTFDNTSFASQTGGAARAWSFTTPPVVPGLYEPTLGIVAAQLCSGDILALPTMCHVEFLGGKPVRAQGTKVTLDFALHEVQPAKVLLRYSPGDTITGESFSRASTAYYINSAGVVTSVSSNVKRDIHYINGVGYSILLEGTRTNSLLWANDFNNAVYAKSTMTVGTGIADPAGGTSACTLTATGANAEAYQIQSPVSSAVRWASVWIRRRTGTGNVRVLRADAGAATIVTVTGSWARYSPASSIASTICAGGVRLDTPGDEVDVWMCQTEVGAFPSSEIPTTTAAVARSSDFYSLPLTAPPGETTVYVKLVEYGTNQTAGARVFGIESAADANPQLTMDAAGGFYRHRTNNGSAAAVSTLASAPARGDTVELVGRLFGDGSVDITQSINGGAATAGTQSAANALAAAWSGQLCWLNSGGTAGDVGFIAILSLKVVAGSRSLSEMRSL